MAGLVVYGRRKRVSGVHCTVWYYDGGVALMTVQSVVFVGLRLESRIRWHLSSGVCTGDHLDALVIKG